MRSAKTIGMGNPNPSPENRWKKGQSGNPKGRDRIPKEIKELIKERRFQLQALFYTYLQLPIGKLEDLQYSAKLPARDVWTIRLILKGISTGDYTRFNFIADRLEGKPKASMELSGSINTAPKLTDAQLKGMAEEYLNGLPKDAQNEVRGIPDNGESK